MQKKQIAIIGAGFGGLTIAQKLAEHAHVTVFEKARGVGGRMATRYADPCYFDHGAQCFTARTDLFKSFLEPFMENGTVAPWQGKVLNFEGPQKTSPRIWKEIHLVAAPNMNSLCKALAPGLNVRIKTELAPIGERRADGWHLFDINGTPQGVYDWVISTAPPAQTLRLFAGHIPQSSNLHTAKLMGCYAVMIGFNKRWWQDWIAARVHDNPIKWISVNSTKPGRSSDVTCFVAHSRNDWAEAHIDDDIEERQDELVACFESITGISCRQADFLSTHRWRYAVVEDTPLSGPFMDFEKQIASTSDWCVTSRIEEVYLCAMQLCQAITEKASAKTG